MKKITPILSTLFAAACLTALGACEPKSDTERLGEKIEDATDDASDQVEKTGDKIEDATDGN